MLVVVMNIFSSPQNCLNKQQFLMAIRHLQQLLKGQETRFAEGVRHMKSRLAALQSSVSKAGPDTPPGGSPGQRPERPLLPSPMAGLIPRPSRPRLLYGAGC